MKTLLKKSIILTASLFPLFSLQLMADQYYPCPSEAIALAAKKSAIENEKKGKPVSLLKYAGQSWEISIADTTTDPVHFELLEFKRSPYTESPLVCEYYAGKYLSVRLSAYIDNKTKKVTLKGGNAGATSCSTSKRACQFMINPT